MTASTIFWSTVVENADGEEIAGLIDGPDGFSCFVSDNASPVAIEALLAAAYKRGGARKPRRTTDVQPTQLDRERATRILRRRGIEVL